MPIYTKTGDDGTTGIFTKKDGRSIRISKSDSLIEAIGSVDEANSYFGIIASEIKQKTKNSEQSLTLREKQKIENKLLVKKIEEIQRDLFAIGAGLAGANEELKKLRTKELERDIDGMEGKLPKLTNFIHSGGSTISAHIMYARTLVRKAERRVVEQFQINTNKYQYQISNENNEIILKYINRLSDYLFVLARWVNYVYKMEEKVWKKLKD